MFQPKSIPEPWYSFLKEMDIRLSAIGGVMMGTFYPLVEIGKSGEKGLGPYAVAFVFGLGVLASVFVYNIYFLKFPISGPRLKFADYLKGSS